MKITAAVGAVAVLKISTALAVIPTDLPHTKLYIDSCAKTALALRQGKVQRIQVRQAENALHIRLLTEEPDGTEWITLCDGNTGMIIQTQRLVDVGSN